jgi:hypothetical protein
VYESEELLAGSDFSAAEDYGTMVTKCAPTLRHSAITFCKRTRGHSNQPGIGGHHTVGPCITDAVSDYVGGKEPGLWIIGGQEFDDAEPSFSSCQ